MILDNNHRPVKISVTGHSPINHLVIRSTPMVNCKPVSCNLYLDEANLVKAIAEMREGLKAIKWTRGKVIGHSVAPPLPQKPP